MVVTFGDPDEGYCLDDLDVWQQHRRPFSVKRPDTSEPTAERKTQDDYLAELLVGDDVHGAALRIVGRMVREGLSDATIRAVFEGLALRVRESRGAERAADLTGGELTRMIAGARKKGYGAGQGAPGGDGAAIPGAADPIDLDAADLDDEVRQVRSALAAIPRDARLRRHGAAAVIGMAIRHADSGIAEDVGAALCAEWDARTGGDALRVFRDTDPMYSATKPLGVASIYAMAREHGWTGGAGEPDPVAEAEAEKHRYIGPPTATPGMYYGPLGEWSKIATRASEANRAAAFVTLAAYAGAAFGRESYIWLDNTRHHPRLNTLHVGRTARGRKGTSAAPAERVRGAIVEADRIGAEPRPITPGAAPLIHTGGLSTREGLAWCLRDPVMGRDKDGAEIEVDPGVRDKRLWVLESEFDNVMSQSGRDGNTLSSALRDCFDGRDLAPLTKTNRTTATAPHVSVCAHVTPAELLERLDERAISNGFLNRFLVFWGEREKRVPFPERIPDDLIDDWARTLRAAVARNQRRAAAHGGEVKLCLVARELYAETYRGEWDQSGPPVVMALLERAPVVALRLALVMALMDHADEIGAEHLACVIEWTRYWRRSVEYIWRDRARLAAAEGADVELAQRAERIVAYLREHGGLATRTDLIAECFRRHISAADLDATIEWGELQTPAWFVAEEVITKTTPTREYRAVMVRIAKTPRESCEPSTTTWAEHTSRDCESCEPWPGADPSPEHTSHGCEPCSGRAIADASHDSPRVSDDGGPIRV